MAHGMCMAVASLLAAAVVQANQCSSGGECPSGSKPKNVVTLLQTKLQMNVPDDGPLMMEKPGATLPQLEGVVHSEETTALDRWPWDSTASEETTGRKLTRVAFLFDSQALESGLDKYVEGKLKTEGLEVALLQDNGNRLAQGNKPGLSYVKDHCQDKDSMPDIFILWMGVNDVAVNSDYGAKLSEDLATVLASIASSCASPKGSPKVVVVQPPLFAKCAQTWRTLRKWPEDKISSMIQTIAAAFETLKQSGDYKIVDAQDLSDESDFDRVGHFCTSEEKSTDQPRCDTSEAISAAIVEAVEGLITDAA